MLKMLFKKLSYSNLITPISYLIDLVIINTIAYLWPMNLYERLLFHSYTSLAWAVLSIKSGFYVMYRYTKVPVILRKLSTQFFFFFLILYAFIGFFKQPNISRLNLGLFFLSTFVLVTIFKLLNYYLLIAYRSKIKGDLQI